MSEMKPSPAPQDPRIPGEPGRARTRLLTALALVWAAIVVFLWLVWPTPYRSADGTGRHRINRFTGRAQTYDSDRRAWKPAKRRPRNTEVTSAEAPGSSPVGGGDREARPAARAQKPSGGSPAGDRGSAHAADRGDDWWYGGSKAKPEAQEGKQGDQWWYEDKDEPKESARQPEDDSDKWWHE